MTNIALQINRLQVRATKDYSAKYITPSQPAISDSLSGHQAILQTSLGLYKDANLQLKLVPQGWQQFINLRRMIRFAACDPCASVTLPKDATS